MNKNRLVQDIRLSKADVCLGTDWFAPSRRPHPAWLILIGFGSNLMAGMKRIGHLSNAHGAIQGRPSRSRRQRRDAHS